MLLWCKCWLGHVDRCMMTKRGLNNFQLALHLQSKFICDFSLATFSSNLYYLHLFPTLTLAEPLSQLLVMLINRPATYFVQASSLTSQSMVLTQNINQVEYLIFHSIFNSFSYSVCSIFISKSNLCDFYKHKITSKR